MKTKKRKPNFDHLKGNPKGMKSDYNSQRVANTRHLKRILVYLQELVDYSWQTDIRENCGIISKKIPDALLFLDNHKLIKSKTLAQGKKIYYSPEKEHLIQKIMELEALRHTLKYPKNNTKQNPK